MGRRGEGGIIRAMLLDDSLTCVSSSVYSDLQAQLLGPAVPPDVPTIWDHHRYGYGM